MDKSENLGMESTPESASNYEASTVCRICGRRLSDPESIKKGIGPVCEARYRLKKIRQQSLGESYPGEHRVPIISLGPSKPINWEELDLVNVAARIEEKKPRCSCGAFLEGRNLRYYGPHEGGYKVQGMADPQWVYVHCDQCPGTSQGYDVALWKIRRELE